MSLKLTSSQTKELIDTLTTVKSLGTEVVLFEPGMARSGMTDFQSYLLFRDIDWELPVLCANRPQALLARLTSLQSEKTVIEYTTATSTKNQVTVEYIKELKIKMGRASASYRCGNPLMVSLPKKINIPNNATFEVSSELIGAVQQAKAAMGSLSSVTLSWCKEAVTIKVYDDSNDVFELPVFEGSVVYEGDEFEVEKSYAYDKLISMFKNIGTTATLTVSNRGILALTTPTNRMYLLPETSNA